MTYKTKFTLAALCLNSASASSCSLKTSLLTWEIGLWEQVKTLETGQLELSMMSVTGQLEQEKILELGQMEQQTILANGPLMQLMKSENSLQIYSIEWEVLEMM